MEAWLSGSDADEHATGCKKQPWQTLSISFLIEALPRNMEAWLSG